MRNIERRRITIAIREGNKKNSKIEKTDKEENVK
jgi:hypothetical protein